MLNDAWIDYRFCSCLPVLIQVLDSCSIECQADVRTVTVHRT